MGRGLGFCGVDRKVFWLSLEADKYIKKLKNELLCMHMHRMD
jgi:hypothetical protein